MAACEIFLQSLDFEPVARRSRVQLQRFSALLIPLIGRIFRMNCPLCNTQQCYSPPGEDFHVPSVFKNTRNGISLTRHRKIPTRHG